jgi:two-component sensor histidine kinase
MSDAAMSSREDQGAKVEVHELPYARGTNAQARSLLTAFLGRHHLGTRVVQDATIVLGELVANGLDHGRPDPHDGLEVSWQLEAAALRLSVLDGGGRTVPHVEAPDSYAPRGRGLAMVQALTTSWWVESNRGTRVVAVLPVE